MAEEKKESFLARLIPSIKDHEQLFIALSIWLAFSGVCLMLLGAFLPYMGEAPETDVSSIATLFKGQKHLNPASPVLVDHSLRVMLFGFILVLLSLMQSIIEGYKRIRDKQMQIDLTGYLKKKDVKAGVLK